MMHTLHGPVSAVEAVETSLARLEARDRAVRAWAHLDADSATAEAQRIDAAAPRSVVHGWTVGIKDVIDTAGAPTAYGSPIWQGHRPDRDADVVRSLIAAGAIVLGKTTTAEFAAGLPPQTRNPHDDRRTPGSSSSGSAAAVADGQVRLAIGTQTGGSTIRPASYCGVYGFKPTYGRWPMTGVQALAPSFDTLSAFARDLGDLAALDRVLARACRAPNRAPALRIGIIRGPWRQRAIPEAWQAIEGIAGRVSAEADVAEVATAPVLDDLEWAQTLVLRVEAVTSLAPWTRPAPDLVSPELRGMIKEASATAPSQLRRARSVVREAREFVLARFRDFDLLLMPSAPDEAPLDQGRPASGASTGDPIFNRLASAVGCPAVSVPAGPGPAGMPLGAQFLAPPRHDRMLLSVLGDWTARGQLPTPPPIPGAVT